MSYPILYQAGETNFQHQGLGVLADSISADVSEDLNGKFELDLVYAYNKSMSKLLVNGNIIKADAGNVLKNQRFTIGQVNRTIDGNIAVHAEHVSYISGDLTLKPKTIVFEQDGQGALNQFVNAIKETDHGLTVYSDVTTVSSSTWAVPDFKNPRDVLGGVEGSILDNWGGEYKYDNKHISLLKQRGSYANTVIAYSRNMTSFEQEDSILETVTSIYPVAVISSQSGDATDAVTHTLPELAVDSQYLNRYDHRKTLLVDFSSEFDDKNPYSDSKLRALANKYIKDNKVGVPKVSMTVSTLDLTKMVADYSASKIERLDLADTVPVYFDKLDIMTDAKVVGSKWNVLKDCYDEYTMGSRKATLGSIIKGSVAEVKSVAEAAKKHAIEALQSANGKNTNYYGNSGDGAPQNPQVGDLWFVKDGENTIIKQWNGTSWVELISTVWQKQFEEELKKELAKAKEELDAALAEKDKAIKDLDTKIAAEMTVIDQSIVQVKSDTVDAKKVANDAVAKANSNIIDLQAAKIDITKALNDSTSALNAVKVVDGRVDSVTTTIANVKIDVDKKADKTTVASQISQSATQVKQDVQSWTNGQLTNYSTIQSTDSSIASAVADKVTQTQWTQLSNQFTSTVSQLSNSTNLFSIKRMQISNDYHSAYPSFLLVRVPTDIGATYIASTDNPNQNLWFIPDINSDPAALTYRVYKGKTVTFTATNTISYAVIRDTLTKEQLSNETYHLKIERGTRDTLWSPSEIDSVSRTQFTQSIDNINLRVVEKGDIVNQINISPESILIAGNKVQITGQTYIENGVISSAKISDLSASKLTAGTIDASLINVTKINASNITTGILSADRIAANSITATHISISSLSALSANLGIVTAGTINAATVNIININASNITTGTLNADRIGANSITADKIKATSLDLFSNDSYTNVRSDGMRIQSKAQIIFGPWIDINGSKRNTQGIYIGGFGGGTKHVALTRSNGTTFLLRAEDGMDYGANQNVAIGALNLYDNVHFWESARVHGNLINEGYIAMGGGIQEASIQYDKSAGTMNFRVPGGRSGSYFWFNQKVVSTGSFDSVSRLSMKNVRGDYQGDALADICATEIVEYSYKNRPKEKQLSPIIDDINEVKRYHLPDIINDGKAVNLYAMSSLSWLAIKQLAQKLENIEEKLDAIA
ncbi:phage tail spike protein [Pseudolactococcus raffinolactis]|uniref:phage tail spike protein n=1 Tax=Pseudolactococcus raffinolactis TaxID=1366 RepID=UPI0014366E3A|nr:phage tail spike protein [Lactococcus raffinolactis]QIW51229.1 hypothetical protein GU337_04735 [Lactococcus raffinolactis]